MVKSDFKIRGMTNEQKDFLYEYAKNELGCRSRNKAILHLIDEAMGKTLPAIPGNQEVAEIGLKRKRLQLSLLPKDYENLEKLAKLTDSSMQYCLIKFLVENLYNEKMLYGGEYELLRKSNYQLHKIGVNLNQIAKAINEGERKAVPIKMLSEEIAKHIDMVKEVLDNSYNKH